MIAIGGAIIGLGLVAWLLLGDEGGGEPDVEARAPTSIAAPASTTTTEPPVYADAELAAEFGDAVWRVEVEGCGIPEASGTAFAIDEHTLITNWHVVTIDTSPHLVSRDGETEITARVVGMNRDPDIAVLETEQALPVTLEWADTESLSEGQHLVALGYPVPALDFSVTSTNIVSFQVEDQSRQAIRSDGNIDYGNSGGPALTSEGRVAGVVTELDPNLEGVRLLSLIYTHASLEETIERMIEQDEPPEPDCSYLGSFGEPNDDWTSGEFGTDDDDSGDDPVLDRLHERCASADWAACDDLVLVSPSWSAYRSFGASCGGTATQARTCSEARGQGAPDLGTAFGRGTCLALPHDDAPVPRSVPCDAPHDAEVVYLHDVPAGMGLEDAYGEWSDALEDCLDPFEEYVGIDYYDSLLYTDAWVTDPYLLESFADLVSTDTASDIPCFAFEPGEVLEESVEGTER